MASIDSLASEIVRELQRYTNLVEEEVEVAKEEVAKDLVSELKGSSPKDTGDYAKGWRTKKVGNAQVVHNATNYQLTHLLEKGHAKVNGGRVAPRVHIRPAEEKAIEEYLDRVERAIRQ
ncbi:HK97 gp10 family phage protein [Peribacillus asahii]|uniref:HK97 gp10 family phage protein n=1 Tax=Peribacillus asahii TaxID=228899 RepID=UPI0037FFD15E